MFLVWSSVKIVCRIWYHQKLWCYSNQVGFFKEFFKNLLLGNQWSDFEIISQDCSWCDPFQKVFLKFWSVEKHGGGGFFHCVHFWEIIQNSSPLKPLVRFWNNFTGLFLGGTLFENCSRNFDPSKSMAAIGEGRETFCTIQTLRNS